MLIILNMPLPRTITVDRPANTIKPNSALLDVFHQGADGDFSYSLTGTSENPLEEPLAATVKESVVGASPAFSSDSGCDLSGGIGDSVNDSVDSCSVDSNSVDSGGWFIDAVT